MFSTDYKFGIELEFTGITRNKAAKTLADYLHGEVVPSLAQPYLFGVDVIAPDGRRWSFVRDASIQCEKKENGRIVSAGAGYSVELVSPILTYASDIDDLQSIVRKLRKAGGFANSSCGIHLHLDGAPHTVRSLRNLVLIVASRNDLFYKALQIEPARMRYCKKMDEYMVRRIEEKKPRTMKQLENIWYAGYNESRRTHYHDSRYHFLNLHSYFSAESKTVELRGFNSTLHAGKVRSYIVFALAINHQALTQKTARYKHVQEENERFAMRTYLTRIGLNGDEYKACREHLSQHLSGNPAWRYGSRDNCKSHIARPDEQPNSDTSSDANSSTNSSANSSTSSSANLGTNSSEEVEA